MNIIPLSIGPIDIDLVFSDPNIENIIEIRYGKFLRLGGMGFPIHIHRLDRTSNPHTANHQVFFTNASVHITSPGYAGEINWCRSAMLDITSENPISGLDYFLRVVTAVLAYEAGGLLFHGAGILHKGKGYIFFGHSGSGKSTVSRLSSSDIVLNDDLLILFPEDVKWKAYATPFWNPTQNTPTNYSMPIIGMFRLVKDQSVFIKPMAPAQAVGELVANTPVLTADPNRLSRILARSAEISKSIPVQWLHFLRDDTFWDVIDRKNSEAL